MAIRPERVRQFASDHGAGGRPEAWAARAEAVRAFAKALAAAGGGDGGLAGSARDPR